MFVNFLNVVVIHINVIIVLCSLFSLVRELAYTGRKFTANEAHSMGLVR